MSHGAARSIFRRADDGHIPMRDQNLEPSLLFAFESRLVRVELFDERLFGAWSVRIVEGGGALENYGDAIIPAPVLGRVVAGLFDLDAHDAAGLGLFLQDRQV